MTLSSVSTSIGCTKILEIICMVESNRVVSDKIGVENLSVCQTNTMAHRMVGLGKSFSQSSQWRLTACELVNGTTSEWYCLNPLSCNESDLSLAPKVLACESSSDLTPGIMVHLTNLQKSPTPCLWGAWVRLKGPKASSNTILCFLISILSAWGINICLQTGKKGGFATRKTVN